MNKSRLTVLLSGLLIISLVVFLAGLAFSLFGPSRGQIDYRSAFELLRTLAYVGAAAAIVAAIFAYSHRKQQSVRNIYTFVALAFAVPVITLAINEATPPPGDFINDISTDLDDPPVFNAVIALRDPGSNPIEYGGAAVAARQRVAHPDVGPVYTNLNRDQAFQKAFETAEKLGWEIVAADPYTGIIEAIATTPFFRFKDDVVIRLREQDQRIRIDLRSRSRVGLSDLGANAKRILRYTQEFEN